MKKNFQFKKGFITIYVLVFGMAFLILLGGLLGFILLQLKASAQRLAWNESLEIAEAGVNYYRWCLNNGVETNCKNEIGMESLTGNFIGTSTLSIVTSMNCGTTTAREITATGWTKDYPQTKRKVKALYGKASVAKYSYILNDNVYVGADHEIRGPYHSNGGIRFDGENQSLVTSAKDTWLCTSSFGCSSGSCPAGCTAEGTACRCPGVFTTTLNPDTSLFSFPVPSFDFSAITMDLAQMKTTAQASGIYLPPSTTTDPNAKGYHLKFLDNGNLEIWLITNLSATYGYSFEDAWHDDYFTITSEYLYNTTSIPAACSVIFVEDNIWPEGKIKGKVTLASANLINPNLDTDVVLAGNIEYTALSGSDGFALIGERNILIGPQSPNQMELRGILIAQKGRFSRNCYPGNSRNKLEIYGSVISNGRVGTKWTGGACNGSGYQTRESYFDPNLVYNPPSFVPSIENQFKIINWEETK